MRPVISSIAVTLALSGCSLSAGAGVGARLGGRPGMPEPQCETFESCDVVYQAALAALESCREDGTDCDDQAREVGASYGALREQTQLELAALRNEVQEREAALARAAHTADATPRDAKKDCSTEQTPVTRHGDGWFDSEH